MKLLIIGAKGFIGSNLTGFFRKKNWDVFECDVSVDYGNPLYIQVDGLNPVYDYLFEKANFDVCINCSGASSVKDSISFPARDFQLNVRNHFLILDSLRRMQPECKIVNLSSAAVYGSPERLPIRETDIMKPISPYGYHKSLAEGICDQFEELWNIKVCSLRIFSAFGDGLQKQLFWDLYQKASNSSRLELFGTGEESRDFIHISDLAQAVELVIANASFKSDKINIANGREISVRDAVRKFLNLMGFTGSVDFSGKVRKGDPVNWRADITKLDSFGYRQNIEFEEGLKQYVRWVRNLH